MDVSGRKFCGFGSRSTGLRERVPPIRAATQDRRLQGIGRWLGEPGKHFTDTSRQTAGSELLAVGRGCRAMNYSNLASRLTPRPPLNREFLRRIARVRAASKRARTQAEKKAAFASARP